MTQEKEAAIATKADRAKIPKSDYVFPDMMKCPITSQTQATNAAKLIGKVKKADGSALTDAEKTAAKSRAKRIMNRHGFTLPKAWQTGTTKAKKKGSEATATMSDDMVRDALNAALSDDVDPDGDGDEDRDNDPYGYDMCWCYVCDVYDDYFVYSFHDKDDGDDSGLYKRSYSINDNDEAILGSDIQRVVKRVTYDPYVDQPDDGMESFTESWVETSSASVITGFEASTENRVGRISGQAIGAGLNKSKKRYYPKETLAAAVEGFAGKKMYINHPSAWDDKNRPERDVMDYAALIDKAWINTEGGISYTAVTADPVFEEKLAHLQERGILSSIGTSVNYTGEARRETIDGIAVDRIESMDLNSLDFVTEAGAWGDVAHLESHAPDGATGGTSREETDMADDAVIKALQEKIDLLTTQNVTLIESISEERIERRKAQTKAAVKDLLAESVLPKGSQDRIATEFDGRESVEGLAERIESEVAYVESLTGKKLEAAPEATSVEREREKIRRMSTPKRIVIGNGGDQRESGERERVPVGAVKESSGWLLGKNAASFEEQFITG